VLLAHLIDHEPRSVSEYEIEVSFVNS